MTRSPRLPCCRQVIHRVLAAFTLLWWVPTGSLAQGLIDYGFDSDAEGWDEFVTFVGTSPAMHQPTGGVPGGYIEIVDGDANNTSFFSLTSFVDLTPASGELLTFNLRSSAGGDPSAASVRVIIEGDDGRFLTNEAGPPTLDWARYTFALDEAAGWRFVTGFTGDFSSGVPATAGDFAATIREWTNLFVLADFLPGSGEVTGLDGVFVPEPATGLAVACSVLWGCRFRRGTAA